MNKIIKLWKTIALTGLAANALSIIGFYLSLSIKLPTMLYTFLICTGTLAYVFLLFLANYKSKQAAEEGLPAIGTKVLIDPSTLRSQFVTLALVGLEYNETKHTSTIISLGAPVLEGIDYCTVTGIIEHERHGLCVVLKAKEEFILTIEEFKIATHDNFITMYQNNQA